MNTEDHQLKYQLEHITIQPEHCIYLDKLKVSIQDRYSLNTFSLLFDNWKKIITRSKRTKAIVSLDDDNVIIEFSRDYVTVTNLHDSELCYIIDREMFDEILEEVEYFLYIKINISSKL